MAEVLDLSEKRRISIGLADVASYFSQYPRCKEHSLDLAVVQTAGQIVDRLIAGTARLLQLPLLTNDPVLQASKFVTTIW